MLAISYLTLLSPLTVEFGEMNKLLNIHFEEVTTWLTSKIPVDEDKMDTS